MTTLKFAKWPIYKLADLLVDFTKKNKNDEKIPVYSVTNEEGFTISTEYFSKEVFSKNLKTYKVVAKNEFAYNPSRVNVGSIDFFRHGGKGLISPLYVTFRTKEILNEKYLKYFLKSPIGNFYIRNNTSGSVRDTLSFRNLSKISIPLPPLEEQKRIVRLLDQADSLRQKRKKAISLLDDYLKAVFLEMFGDPVTNPKRWEKQKFSKLGTLDRGKSKHRPRNAPELLGGDHPLIQTGDVANSGIYIDTYTATYSDIGLKQSKKWPKGTLCITIAANIAKTGILDFEACFPDSVVGFVANRAKTNNEFIHFWISFLQEMLERNAPESAQKNINLKILRNLDVITPPIELQNKFSEIVKKSEGIKYFMFTQSNDLETNFNSIMQRSFSL